jgi:hypothetical protein
VFASISCSKKFLSYSHRWVRTTTTHICHLNTIGEHAVYCRELPNFKYKYSFVRDVLCDIFKRTCVYVKKEVSLNFLINPHKGRSSLSCSVLWLCRNETCMCWLDWSFSTCGIDDFTVGQTTLKIASIKMVKNEKICSYNQHFLYTICVRHFLFPRTYGRIPGLGSILRRNNVWSVCMPLRTSWISRPPLMDRKPVRKQKNN